MFVVERPTELVCRFFPPMRGDDVNRASRRQVVRRIRVAGIWINVAVETVNERANELNGRFVATHLERVNEV